MDDFMLLVKGDDRDSSPEQMQQLMMNYQEWMQKWKSTGNYISGSPFVPEGKYLKSKTEVHDSGEFLDPQNIIGGYIWLKGKSLDEAVSIASECPLLENLEIMVRPFMKLDDN